MKRGEDAKKSYNCVVNFIRSQYPFGIRGGISLFESVSCQVEQQKKIVAYLEELVLADIQSFSSSPNYF